MQHRATFDVSAAVNESNVVQNASVVPFQNSTRALLRMIHCRSSACRNILRVETFRPFDHRRVKVRMRNSDRADAAARFHFGDGFIVGKRNAIPEQISVGRCSRSARWPMANSGSCRYREGAALPPQAGCGDRSLTFRASSTVALGGEQIAFVFANRALGRRLSLFSQTAFRIERR